MSDRTPPFTMQLIGTGSARFSSGVAIPSASDVAVDPYMKTRMPKEVQIDCLQFWPQEKGPFPGLVLLHEWWGLNSQIKDLGGRLACEGYGVLIPNLYGRLGGMVTGNAEVAEALMAKNNDVALLQDINSCCEFLNTRDYLKRQIHGVIGYGMGGSLAIRFACHRKRLRAAVAFYGKMVSPPEVLKSLYCPLLYHRGDQDEWATQQDVDQLHETALKYGKRVDIRSYANAPHAFCDETKQKTYQKEATTEAWEATVAFLKTCFQGT